MGKVASSPLPYRGSPPLQSGGQNQKWPTSGQNGYLTPAVSGIPTASERGAESEVAHKWAKWLPHPCRIGDPHRFRAGGRIRSGPQVGKMATSPLPYRGSPALQSGGQNQKRNSIVEMSVSRFFIFFFWRKSRNFFFFGVGRVNFFFWRKSLFYIKKKRKSRNFFFFGVGRVAKKA